MGLKLLVIVALLVCATMSADENDYETDDDGTPDITEGSGDSNIPDEPPFPYSEPPEARTIPPRRVICYRSRQSFDPNITAVQLNTEPAPGIPGIPGNKTSIPGGAAGLIFSPLLLVLYIFIFVVSHF